MESGLQGISALFQEGTEANLGTDQAGKPVVVWMNKLNSFEVEESLRDASVARAERMASLGDDSSEVRGAKVEVDLWSDDDLAMAIVSFQDAECTMEALNNLQAEHEGWMELEDHVRRGPQLLADDGVQPGDPRFETLNDKMNEYMRLLNAEVSKVTAEHLADLKDKSRPKLEAKFMEQWRSRRTTDEWQGAKRMTEIWLSARRCEAVLEGGGRTLAGEMVWDHSACDHSVKQFSERKQIRRIPDGAMQIIVRAFESLQMSPRDMGNSDAPASSSASSEPSSTPEEASSPSSLAETPEGALTT